MRTFVEKVIEERSFTELDLLYPYYSPEEDETGKETGEEVRNEVMSPRQSLTWAEVPSMDIDEAIEALKGMKEKGANRVYFADHEDHHGYYFYGTKLMEI